MVLFAGLIILAACADGGNTAPSAAPVGNSAIEQITAESPIIKKYRAQIQKCDETASYNLKYGDLTTTGMDLSVDKQIKCYKSVAHEIIDKYYSKQAKDMKKDLDDYIKLSYKTTFDMYWPDSCHPTCGTITTNIAYGAAVDTAKRYLDDLIRALDY